MKRNINNAKLTKDFIFSKVSQVSIFSAYTGIEVETIQHCIDTGDFVQSPFRIDNHPSFGFRYDNRNKLKGRDFAGYWWGDCIDAVATVLSEVVHRQIDVSNKEHFQFVLKHIAYTFSDIIYGKEKDPNINDIIYKGIDSVRNKKQVIELVTRPWNINDSIYWKSMRVDFNLLNTRFIYAVDQFYINRSSNPSPKYYYDRNPQDVCYAYVLGQDKRGIVNIKLYFPNRDKKNEVKFITNCNVLEGILHLELDNYDAIIITKSTKDRISLESYLRRTNLSLLYGGLNASPRIGIINIPHETYNLRQVEYDWLNKKLKDDGYLISFMDNDKTGKREAVKLKNDYNIVPILIPDEYEVKDFSELVSKYSDDTINQLTKETINYITENYAKDVQFTWDTEENNSLPY
jgi:hypothetical protein